MKRFFNISIILLIIAGCIYTMPTMAQTTEGTEFYLTFMSNYTRQTDNSGLQLKLIVSSREQTSVTVSNPNTSWTKTVNVAANNISEVIVPNAQCYTVDAEKISKTGLYVKSDKPISLYASNYSDASYDATNVLPITALTGNYIIQTYEVAREEAGYAKEFAVIATDNNTIVEITPHARTTTGKLKNSTFSITLNKGEVYQVMSVDNNNDLSGSIIHASKPVAVFSGNQCANIPSGCDWCDHIVEQAMPTSLWGKQFAITAALQQTENRVLITAITDGTEIRVNGELKATINRYKTYEYIMGSDQWSCFIETSQPAACYLYIEGGKKHKGMGDPSSVHISPFEQKINKMTFSTFATSRTQWHYVNIVTTTNGKSGMQLDGKDIHGYFTALDGNSDLVYARIRVEHGTHTITNDIDGFTAWVYGLGTSESYAYTAGSATHPLDAQILVDNRPGNETEMRTFCYQHQFAFAPQVNIDFTNIKWQFGDGTSASTPTPKHRYDKIGDYTITMTVSNSAEEQTISTILHLVNTPRDTVYATICEGETYTFNGQKYDKQGTYTASNLKSKDGCDSVAVLVLDVAKSYQIVETKEIARGQTYKWHGNRYSAGTYYDNYLTVQGCDSTFTLKVTEVDIPLAQKDTICYEPTYLFMGHEYPLPSVDNFNDKKYIDYRLKYFDTETCQTYTMDLAIVPAQEQTIERNDTISSGTAYDFYGNKLTETGTYRHEEPLGCHGSFIDILHLVVMPYPIIESAYTLCKQTDNIKFYGRTIEEAGEYYDTIYTEIGIGEIRHLSVVDNKTYSEISVSDMRSFTINGETYTESGIYQQVLKNAAGCDSVLTINVGIGGACKVTSETSTILCEGQTLEWNGQIINKEGEYTSNTLKSSQGCDSVATLHVTTPHREPTVIDAAICEGDFYRYNDDIITSEGDHYYHYTAADGCDSTVNVRVKFNQSYFIADPHVIVEGKSITWEGEIYTEAGFYTKPFVSVRNGCDSIRQLQLTVIEPPKEYQHAIYLNKSNIWSNYDYFSVYYWDEHTSGYVSMQPMNCDKQTYFAVLPYGEWENVIFRCHNSYIGNATDTWGSADQQTVDLKFSTEQPLFHLTSNNLKADGYWSDIDINEHCSTCLGQSMTLTAPVAGDLYLWNTGEITQTITINNNEAGTFTHTCKVFNIDPTVKDNLMPNGDFETVPDDTTKFSAFYSEYKNYGFQPNFKYAIYAPYWTPTFDPMNTFAVVCNRITYIDQPSFNIMPHGNYGLYIDGGMDPNVSMAWQAKSIDHPDLKIIKDSIYIFSYYVLGGGHENPAVLQFRLSYRTGNTYTQIDLGEPYTTSGYGVGENVQTSDWVQRKIIFKAPVSSDDISIELYDLTFAPMGNDFVLDDICFNLVTDQNRTQVNVNNIEIQVNDVTYGEVKASVPENKTYEYKGKAYTAPGEYTITLENQNQYGCDSIVTLYLTVSEKGTRTQEFNAEICEGEYYDFYGDKLTESNTYTHKEPYDEYDSIITLILKVNPIKYEPVYKNITEGQTLEWNGQTYSETGEYPFKTKSVLTGCDSIATLYLTVSEKGTRTQEFNAEICEGEYYDFYDKRLYVAGTVTHTEPYAEYDSIITLNLIVNRRYERDTTITIMEGESILWGGQEISQIGYYPLKLQTIHGCDSIINLLLRVEQKQYVQKSEKATICNGETYDFYGRQLTESGTYTHEITTTKADTTITLNLTVEQPSQTDLDIILPDNGTYTYHGTTYTHEGIYEVYLKTKNGCDSLVILHIESAASMRIDNASIEIETICANENLVLQLAYDNEPDSIRLTFSGRNKGQGFEALTIKQVSPEIVIQHEAKAGNYKLEAKLYKKGKVAKTIKTDFSLLYPSSVIEQGWNDALIVLAHAYNGGYDFKAFQWYKNGEIIEGENHSYMYQPLEMGAVYSAMLTEKDNTQLMTCGIIAVPHEDIYLYPTQFRIGQKATCRVSSESMMYIYDTTGKMVYSNPIAEGESEQVMPQQQGLYIVRIVLNDSQHSQQFKIMVKD